MTTDFVSSTLMKLITSYKKWITANPQLLSDIETTIKCCSYLGIGHLSKSSLILELSYTIPNLMVLFNDLIIYSNRKTDLKIPQFESKIKIFLAVVEFTETLFEVSAEKLCGQVGRWCIIAVIQIFKALMRLLLIYIYKERITKHPPITQLNREKLIKPTENVQLKGFTLKRSGAVVRGIKDSVPIEMRTWKALRTNRDENENLTKTQEFKRSLKLAESLYVVKPLLHLGCISLTNQQHWQPWILSLAVDIISLKMYDRFAQHTWFSKEEKQEFLRRRISLLLYMLRSPFYDKYSRTKIVALLDKLSTSVPFAKLLADPLKRNLPYMQSTYFYMWSC